MKIFGKTLKEYLWPIKWFIIGAILVVISQYYLELPLSRQYPWILNLSQAAWALLIVGSIWLLVKKHDFEFKHIFVLGIFYSIIIHGLKAFFFRIFLFPYSGTFEEVTAKIIYKFFYGSFLVMAIAIILGILFPYFKKKKQL